MSKEKEKESSFELVVKSLNKKYFSNKDDAFFVSTGSITLDLALGGKGLSSGRITELMAWEGSGKTTLCLHLIANAQKAGYEVAYIDSEHALDERYARAIGVDWDKLVPEDDSMKMLFQTSTGEDAFDIASNLLKTGKVKVIIFDSTSGMIPESQFEADAGGSNMGKHAKLFSSEIPKINALAAKHNAIVVFVSQLREKIGVMFGSPETTQAGNALKFFASNRIRLSKTLVKDGDETTGITVGFKVLKCKTAKPFKTGSFPIVFGEGIDNMEEVVDLATDLGIIKKSGSWYAYGETKIGQGISSVKQLLKDNPELYQEITLKVKENGSEVLKEEHPEE